MILIPQNTMIYHKKQADKNYITEFHEKPFEINGHLYREVMGKQFAATGGVI